MSRNDLPKHKTGQKKTKSKPVEQNWVSKCQSIQFASLWLKTCIGFDSKSASKLVYESPFLFAMYLNNASESVCKNLFGLNCILNTNYGKNVIEIQNTFWIPIKYKIPIMYFKYVFQLLLFQLIHNTEFRSVTFLHCWMPLLTPISEIIHWTISFLRPQTFKGWCWCRYISAHTQQHINITS